MKKKKVNNMIADYIIKIIFNDSNNIIEGDKLIKLQIGIKIILENIYKVLLIFLLSFWLNIFFEMLIILISFSWLRKFIFGVHAKSSLMCTAATATVFGLGVFLSKLIIIDEIIIITVFIFYIILIYLYAPSDTEYHPLIGAKLRKSLRNRAIRICVILMLISIHIENSSIQMLILIGVLIAVIGILPITYKLMKRSYRNYEQYEEL